MTMPLSGELKAAGIAEVADDAATRAAYSHDASIFEVPPAAVVFPRDAEELKRLVKFASEHAGTVSLTARGGGTDMTGGAVTSSVVVDMTRHLNRVISVGDGRATAEPGIKWLAFEKATLEKGLLMPTYPASRTLAALGGVVANNAGGEKSLAYGQTKDYVRSVRAVLADGNEYELGPLNREQLNAKLAQQDWEGELYRTVYWLLEENFDLIRQAKPRVSKNSAGYLLWEAWDRKTFNLAKLLCGSQGTLGLISQVTMDLVRPTPKGALLVVFMRELKPLADVVNAVLAYKPETLESFDDKTLSFTLRFLGDFIRLLGAKNMLSLAWQFLPELRMVLTGGIPKMVLLCEFRGDDDADIARRVAAADDAVRKLGMKTRRVHDPREAAKYWTIRRESFNVLRHHSTTKKTVPFIDDIIVPPEHLPEFLPRLRAILDPYKLTLTINGHAGNGNFHIIPLMDLSRPDARKVIEELSAKVYDLVLEYDGSITAEHNDGLIRGPYLKKMYGEEVYELFRKVKHIFDPKGIFNPGKKIDVDWEWAMWHLRKS